MTDPTAAVSMAAGAGIGAMIIATLGVEPHVLLYSGCGATVGVTLAQQAGRIRSALVFGAVVLLSAVVGTWFANAHLGGAPTSQNAAAGVIGLLFHPIFSAVVSGIPKFLDVLTARFGAKP